MAAEPQRQRALPNLRSGNQTWNCRKQLRQPMFKPLVPDLSRLVNALDRTVVVRWLEASAAGPHGRSYYFVWKVLYDTVGETEHVRRIDRTAKIDVPAGGVETGVQIQAPTLSDEVAWTSGDYTFQLWGWADRKREGEPANLRTEFKVSVSDSAAKQVKWLLEADDATWERLQGSHDAIGIPVFIGNVRAGLPAP